MKNKEIFFRIMIAVVMTGSFLSAVAQALAQNVIIATDKTEYTQEEKINASLSYKEKIYSWENGWLLQRWENGSWVNIYAKGDRYFLCGNIPVCKDADLETIEVCPGMPVLCEREMWYEVKDTPEFTWDQSYNAEEKTFQCHIVQAVDRKCVIFKQAPPGRYKISFEYALTIGPNDRFNRDNIDIKYAEKEIVIK